MPAQTAADRGEQTRERLLRAATELIVEAGWGQVSTRAVAQRAGVPAGAVHYHYPSVAALLRAAVAPVLAELVGRLTAGLAEAPDVPAGIRRLFDAVTGPPGDDGEAVLLGEVFMQASRDPTLRAEVAGALTRLRGELTRWLKAHGHGRRAAPVATVLAAALDALGMHRALDPGLKLTGVEAVLVELARGAAR